MTPTDLWKTTKSYWEEKRMEFLTEKTKEMKQILPTVGVYYGKHDTIIINAGDTSDRHPCCEKRAWHKYWQIATVNYDKYDVLFKLWEANLLGYYRREMP